MLSVAITNIGDKGLLPNVSGVDLNECVAISQMFTEYGVKNKIIYRDNLDEANKYDALFIKVGVIVNWGGIQTKWLQSTINLINNFNGPVFMLTVDQDSIVPNKERTGFLQITHPIHFLYVGKGHSKAADKEVKDLNIIDSHRFNHCVQIGKEIARMQFLTVKPQFDAVYGGQARKELMPLLKKIANQYKLLVFEQLSEKNIPNAIFSNTKFNFDNAEIRSINSMGNYSFLFFKPKTRWLTPRIFEQMCSNSLAMFDKRWTETKPFWTSFNTFDSFDELLEKIGNKPTEDQINEQHEIVRNFDYDSYNGEQISNIIQLLK